MERNYKVIQILDKYYIELETYSNSHSKWITGIFKDMNGDDLAFFLINDAENWIDARRDIVIAMDIYMP